VVPIFALSPHIEGGVSEAGWAMGSSILFQVPLAGDVASGAELEVVLEI
jgi:hypothetical protein